MNTPSGFGAFGDATPGSLLIHGPVLHSLRCLLPREMLRRCVPGLLVRRSVGRPSTAGPHLIDTGVLSACLCHGLQLFSTRSSSGGGGLGRLFSELRKSRKRVQVERIEAQLQPLRNAKEWNQLLTAHAKVGNHKRAFGMPGEMREAGVAPDEFTYGRLITVCNKGGQWELALSLLGEMREVGVAPNVITFSAAISACEKGGQWERALSLLGEMREAGVAPDVITFSAAISACEKGGQWRDALRLFEHAAKADLLARVTFNAVLDAVCTHHPVKARELWQRGVKHGHYSNVVQRQENGHPKLDLHDHSEGAAETAVRWWLEERVPKVNPKPTQLIIVTDLGWSKSRTATQRALQLPSSIGVHVARVLSELGVPLLPTEDQRRLVVDAKGL